MKIIDMHTHSSFSDGTLSPTELIAHAKHCGLSALALTDHDTAEGVDEALCAGAEYGIEVIAGIELVAEYKNEEIHILGYFIEHNGQYFINTLNRFKQIRIDRNERLLKRLVSLGMDITHGDLQADGKTITRLHFAKALAAKGYVKSREDAFERYLSTGCPAFVGRNAPDCAECIEVIKRAGGIPVIAHPYSYKWTGGEVIQMVDALCGAGMRGIEAYYPTHMPAQVNALKRAAAKHRVIVTGGSDYHGENRQTPIGAGGVGYEILEEMKKEHGKNTVI